MSSSVPRYLLRYTVSCVGLSLSQKGAHLCVATQPGDPRVQLQFKKLHEKNMNRLNEVTQAARADGAGEGGQTLG